MYLVQSRPVPAANAVFPVKPITQTVTGIRLTGVNNIWAFLTTAESAEISVSSLTDRESAQTANVY
jgi:hypothetical protein